MDVSEKTYIENCLLKIFDRRWSFNGLKTLIKISVWDL